MELQAESLSRSVDQEIAIELHFPIIGSALPADHGYLIYSAISRILPFIHDADCIGIHSIPGFRDGQGLIRIPSTAILKIRMPIGASPKVYKLAGRQLNVDGCHIRLGMPLLHCLQPSPQLRSRLVVIKMAGENQNKPKPDVFGEAARRQLAQLEISGTVRLEPAGDTQFEDPFARRVVTIRRSVQVGYGVYVEELNDADSIRLQTLGLGGRRKMGCGLFTPMES